ncbi:MAG TPA: hypothetical protein PL180_03715 [Spirochaetota bacterium]|nr:hypothetical protein [Spirochaetota bacterium]HRS75784.1 hypothetical protein [Spirochaetota bacterium]HRT73664.1 hypothetical protein [Spirochaetota bacterium]
MSHSRTTSYLLAVFAVTCSFVLFAQPGQYVWQKIFGLEEQAGGKTEDIPSHVFNSKDGGFVIAGMSKGESEDVAGGMYVAKLDKAGRTLWIKYPANDSNYFANPSVFTATADGGFLFGGRKYFSIGLTKINEHGEVVWDRKYELENAKSILFLTEMKDGNISAILYGRGGAKAVLLKVDRNGSVLSFKKLSSDIDGFQNGSMSYTKDGFFIMAGTKFTNGYSSVNTYIQDLRLMKLDGEGTVIWDKSFGGVKQDFGRHASGTADGGFIAAGCSSSFNARNEWDFYIVRVDANGNRQWEKNYGGIDTNYIRACNETPDGGYICGGTRIGKGGSQYLLMKLDCRGNKQWEKLYGEGKLNLMMNGFTVASDGGYAFVGQLETPPAVWVDMYAVKTDDKGNTGPFPSR